MIEPVKNYDFCIVGAGIVGMTIAYELKQRGLGSVCILEKESDLGKHCSGRNSGVMHAGIYYATDSFKAKVCSSGSRMMREFAKKYDIPFDNNGKVIVATEPETVSSLETLYNRAVKNGVNIKKISKAELKEIEPEAVTHEYALHSPDTGVIDSKQVLKVLKGLLEDMGVDIFFDSQCQKVNPDDKTIKTPKGVFHYGFLINAAGLHADVVASPFGVGEKYRILPFKGIYWSMSEKASQGVRGSIYPAPDVKMPFLGVHVTRGIDGKVMLGPTAIPAFGRENYGVIDGLDLLETPRILKDLAVMFFQNKQNFRKMVKEEVSKYIPENYLKACQKLMPSLKREDIVAMAKVGLRPQLVNRETMRLEMDFVLEKSGDSLHVLNAISPAFTSSFAFAKEVVDQVPS